MRFAPSSFEGKEGRTGVILLTRPAVYMQISDIGQFWAHLSSGIYNVFVPKPQIRLSSVRGMPSSKASAIILSDSREVGSCVGHAQSGVSKVPPPLVSLMIQQKWGTTSQETLPGE